MSNDLAQYCAQSSANGDQLNSLLLGGNARTTYWDGLYPYPWYPTYVPTPVYPLTINTYTITTGHRICTCPNCDGSCCDCADCKVKRLEQRVADLEKERGA